MDYGLPSLLPPLVAIVLAIALRQVLVPLMIAIVVGATILVWPTSSAASLPLATIASSSRFIWESISSYDHLRALVFSLSFGAMVGVLEVGGGMTCVANRLATKVRSRRGAQTLITALGLGIFFDDYANALLVGGTMRSTADRFGISRAKLAYIVDTTSAPVAGLSPISTWVVTEISYIAIGLKTLASSDVSAFGLLLASLPFRFYPIFAILFLFTIAISDRDFGPMRYVTGHPDKQDDVTGNEAVKPSSASTNDSLWLASAAIVPVVASVLTVLIALLTTGWAGDGKAHSHWLGELGAKISSGDSYGALIYGGVTGLILAATLYYWLGGVAWKTLQRGAIRGLVQMIPAMLILWLAWALADQTGERHLNTGRYIASLLDDRVPVTLLPTAVFIISSAVAFSTGTSWGTMAILVPIAMQLGLDGAGAEPYHWITLATVGSVLAGAIFGDHCSPISDTTVLSSRASGCDHLAHVRTQAPYAICVAAISILAGTLPAAFGVPSALCLLVGGICTILIVLLLGRKQPTAVPETKPIP